MVLFASTGKEGLVERIADEVSDPKSPRFRQYLTKRQLLYLALPCSTHTP